MGNSKSKKLDTSNTPAAEKRPRRQETRQPVLPEPAKQPATTEAPKVDSESNAAAKVAAAKMPIDCHYMPQSAPCRAVMLTAKLVGVELNLKLCNIMVGEHLKEEYVKMNPMHSVPTINDNGFILWESRSIMAYLVNQYGKDDTLYPQDPKHRAIVDQRLYFDMDTLYKRLTEYYFPTLFTGVPLDDEKLAKLEEALVLFNTLLEGKKFAAGEQLTIADVTLVVTVSNLEAFGMNLAAYPNVKRWYETTKEALMMYGYEDINQSGANTMGEYLKAKLG